LSLAPGPSVISSLVPRASHLFPSAAILAALVFAGCGRTALDAFAPLSAAGGQGGAAGQATAGTSGLAGQAGTLGQGGLDVAGAFGQGGLGGGGQGGSSLGGGGGQATAGTSGTCPEGTNTCADTFTGEICMGGVFVTFMCPMGCFNGVCAECQPGTSSCASDAELQVCSDQGVLLPTQPCPGACSDGACTGCMEGATRCASHEGEQTCMANQWTAAVDCPFVCVGSACAQNVKHVFVTSQIFEAGAFGGIPGADDICRKLAVAAGLSSSYAAWLSDSTTSPVARFPEDAGPYELVDGTIVANNWTDLTSGQLRHAIDLTELGMPPPTAPGGCAGGVWSDTTEAGALLDPTATCGDWADPTASMTAQGSTTSIDMWSAFCEASTDAACSQSAPFYCFEQ
jgi:hypothetical protein